MRKFLTVMVLALSPLASTSQEKVDNPYLNAKVGDFAEYTDSSGGKVMGTLKITVTAKDDKELTLQDVGKILGQNFNQTRKMDLTKPFDNSSLGLAAGMGSTFEKGKQGTETIKVGDKYFECTWTEGKTITNMGGFRLEYQTKVWNSKSAPLSGLVKSEIRNGKDITTRELTKFGSKK